MSVLKKPYCCLGKESRNLGDFHEQKRQLGKKKESIQIAYSFSHTFMEAYHSHS